MFVENRKLRIEVGLGLEKVITNDEAARVLREFVTPAFRREAYADGLRDAIQELRRLLLSSQS